MPHSILFLMLLNFVLFPQKSIAQEAYLPDYHMILSRVAENNGRGTYEIEQEVIFPHDPEPLRVKETWIIKGEHDMALHLEGLGPLKGHIGGHLIYDRGQKSFIDNGKVRSQSLTEDWWQPFFHFRYSKNIRPVIVALKMAPAESLQPRKLLESSDKEQAPLYAPQPFIRLSRTGGVVNYAIGTPTPVNSSSNNPGLWIEQDLFLIRKIRLPSQTLIVADDYARYPRYQWMPKTMKVTWDQNHVDILVSKVDALSSKDKRNLHLNKSSLKPKDADAVLKLPEQPVIREFYQRFR